MATTSKERDFPTVIIVGAGLGGLVLAILLERMGINYMVLERSSQFRSLGEALDNWLIQQAYQSFSFSLYPFFCCPVRY